MSVKILFEVGHVASLKSKITQEGFTHDWELFVRGCDSVDISPYIEKVVFTLHESFPKPKRVVKEPPYSIKESGYAGFVLPIDIYFKCRDETKKLTYSYDLSLQTTGTFTNTDKKSHLFRQPSDDFRRKLLRGGGIPVGSSSIAPSSDDKAQHNLHSTSAQHEDARLSQLINKPKMSGSDSTGSKKYKTKSEESAKVSNQYANLFGSSGGSKSSSSKVSPDAKKASPSVSGHGPSSVNPSGQSTSSSSQKTDRSSRGEKSDREKKEKNKHSSPAKDKVERKHEERREEKRKDKTHSKDRDRNREKSSKHASTASPKPSGVPAALTRSPKLSQSPVIGSKSDEAKQSASKHSAPAETSSSDRPSSSAKKSKKDKKEKSHDSRDRDRRLEKEHKSKEERSSSKNSDRISDAKTKDGSSSTIRPPSAVPVVEVTPTKDKPRVVEPPKPIEHSQPDISVVSAPKPIAVPSGNPHADTKSVEKSAGDSERKHKHKKKDKTKEREHSKDKKKERSSRNKEDAGSSKKTVLVPAVATQPITSSSTPTNTSQPPPHSKSHPLNKLLSEIGDKFSSDSDDDHHPTASDKSSTMSENPMPNDSHTQRPTITPFDELPVASMSSSEKSHKRARKDTKSSAEKDEKKRKRKSKDEGSDLKRKTPSPAVSSEPPTKKREEHNHTPSHQPTSNTRNHMPSPDLVHQLDQRSSSPHFPTINHHPSPSPTTNHPPSAPTPPNRPRSSPPESAQQPTSDHTEPDYMSVLKSLQHKIMTLEDHGEVQHVVELIAETGCYEMTTNTFDFDLCVLDRKTVQRLVDFFATTCT